MFFERRAKTKPLAEFLRRLGMSLESGIDIRKALASEVKRSPPSMQAEVEAIQADVAAGQTFHEAVARCGNFFPPMMRALVDVGEQTGHLPEVLKQLNSHYELQLALRRSFITSITWPLVQFGIALFTFGFLIWISGVIGSMTGNKTDILQIGLTGTSGLMVYLLFLAAVAGCLWYLYFSMVHSKPWVVPIQRGLLKAPILGRALRTLAIARFAWALQLATGTALDVKRSLRLALNSTHHPEFTKQIPAAEAGIQHGEEIHEVLADTGVFPIEFINAVQVGEESGRLTESLGILANQYQDEARRSLAVLTQFAGYGVWGAVAAFIIFLIFRIFLQYTGMIYDLAK